MQKEHDELARILKENGAEVVYADCSPTDPDAINVRDNGIVVKGGIIIARMGVVAEKFGRGRRGEEAYVTRKVAELGMPVLHTIQGDGLMEGGSFCMLDESHAAIGMSYRGNRSAVEQVRSVLSLQGVELIEVPLTGYSLHIDGAIVMVDHGRAMINVERLPYWFIDRLGELGIEGIQADYRDAAIGINSLAIAPGKVIVCSEAPWTAERLTAAGVEVIEARYSECRKKGGGIHCGTLPLIRELD
jgi:N-dimethylarginine dimethylaminohydrolase